MCAVSFDGLGFLGIGFRVCVYIVMSTQSFTERGVWRHVTMNALLCVHEHTSVCRSAISVFCNDVSDVCSRQA